ncbi:455_t:CDS:2 [Entrophospora sp. SA101]|nr:455_t:CDS:2 [Entrophospora sp. SA101]
MSVLESMVEAINEQNVAIKNFESEYEDYKNKLKTLQDYKNKLINKKLGLKQDIIQANKLIEDAKNYYTEDDLNRFSKIHDSLLHTHQWQPVELKKDLVIMNCKNLEVKLNFDINENKILSLELSNLISNDMNNEEKKYCNLLILGLQKMISRNIAKSLQQINEVSRILQEIKTYWNNVYQIYQEIFILRLKFPTEILKAMPDLETELLISPKEDFESKVSNPMIEEGTDNHDKLKVAIDLMGDHAVTGELLKPFDSLINAVMELIRKNYGSFEDAQYNRKFCNCLLDRIEFIEQPMKNLRARKNLMILLLIDQNYYDTLLCLIAILKESQRLINEISFLWNLRKFRATNDIKIHFERVTEEFDKVLSKLNLEKPFDYEAQKKKDLKAIEYDISTMNKFLESVEGSSITLPNSNMEINPIFETVTLIKARLTEVNPNEITIKRIPPNELIRIYHHLCRKNDQPGGGGNVKVKRWLCGEKGNFGNDHNIIEQSYSGIIRAAWQNDPLLRPYLYLIFLKLDELSKDNPIEEGSSLSAMLRFQKYDDSDQVVEIIYDDNEVETKNEEEILPVNKDSNLDIVPVVSIYLALNFVLQL